MVILDPVCAVRAVHASDEHCGLVAYGEFQAPVPSLEVSPVGQ